METNDGDEKTRQDQPNRQEIDCWLNSFPEHIAARRSLRTSRVIEHKLQYTNRRSGKKERKKERRQAFVSIRLVAEERTSKRESTFQFSDLSYEQATHKHTHNHHRHQVDLALLLHREQTSRMDDDDDEENQTTSVHIVSHLIVANFEFTAAKCCRTIPPCEGAWRQWQVDLKCLAAVLKFPLFLLVHSPYCRLQFFFLSLISLYLFCVCMYVCLYRALFINPYLFVLDSKHW